MDDDQILARGGTQEDIDRIAHNNGACGATCGGTCDYCGKTDTTPSPVAESELDRVIERIRPLFGYDVRQMPGRYFVNHTVIEDIAKFIAAQNDATYAKVMEAIPEIEYRKLEPCPACGAAYMYQCSCDVASDYLGNKFRQSIDKIFGKADAKPEERQG